MSDLAAETPDLPGVDRDLDVDTALDSTLGAPGTATQFEPIAFGDESTVVAAYEPGPGDGDGYQSEDELERTFIRQLRAQAYEYLSIASSDDLEVNLRRQLETLNKRALNPSGDGPDGFTDAEWGPFFAKHIANKNDGIIEKTKRIQRDHVQVLERDDGSIANIALIDKDDIHNNRLQVINQYATTGAGGGAKRNHRYDVTILVNGLPLVHVELKRRGVPIREAFNQIDRYQRESFWSDSGLFEYVQLFVISNGTHTKYYANTTRAEACKDNAKESAGRARGGRQESKSFQFTSWWSDANNKRIGDLRDFTKTFFARRTLLNVLTKFCVLDIDETLLVLRPYQIVAAEQILHRVMVASNQGTAGTIDAGGYIWHTTGSGKTLTSFKTAQLVSDMRLDGTTAGGVSKVLFVVDRKDLDAQTKREYDRYEKDAVNGTNSTAHLKTVLEDTDSKIVVTTIQKLANFIKANPKHPVYNEHVVLIFDECHRSQFGDMGAAIRQAFKKYHLFGFTGTPIFAENAGTSGDPSRRTTEQTFGARLHSYTVVDAIHDGNVLPFKVEYHTTVGLSDALVDKPVEAIDTDEVILAAERISQVTTHILDHFNTKTLRTTARGRNRAFNGMFAVHSIDAAKRYYREFERQQRAREEADPSYTRLRIATIFSYAPNEEDPDGFVDDESLDAADLARLDQSSRDFLEDAIRDYNKMNGTSFDTSSDGFDGYYADLADRIKGGTARRPKRPKIDLVIVVNMFLTGFDAVALNTLWVDKRLRSHGLIQAFSRTNRILDSVKTFGNIICFRNLEKQVDDAVALFGNKEARGIILLKPFADYYAEYARLVGLLTTNHPDPRSVVGETAQRDFVVTFGRILRVLNVLKTFDDFEGRALLTERQVQDYTSTYQDLAEESRKAEEADRESILQDVIFEIELIRQVDINIDYVLAMVEKWRASKGDDSTQEAPALKDVESAIDASPSLRSKKDLILAFIDSQRGGKTNVTDDWEKYVAERREAELVDLIEDENLNEEQTRSLIEDAFRDGAVPTLGTSITKLMPPVSRFTKGGDLEVRLSRVTDRLVAYFERFGLLGYEPAHGSSHDPHARPVVDLRFGALTLIVEENTPPGLHKIVPEIVERIDAIAVQVVYSGWSESDAGDEKVRRELRKVLKDFSLAGDQDLFDKTYAYVRENY